MNRLHLARPVGRHPVPIACINNAEIELDVPFGKLTEALQKCYDRHFLPVWGYPVRLYNTKKPKAGDWQMIYFDDADEANADGYHDLTDRGQPLAKVFVKSALESDKTVSIAASHELFEMAIDPITNLWASKTNRTWYAYEVCDPVEEDVFKVDGVRMSNFVYPSWFEPFEHPKKTRFDHLGLLKEPFEIRETGYVSIKRDGRVLDRWGSPAKKARFQAEDRRLHRSEYRRRAAFAATR